MKRAKKKSKSSKKSSSVKSKNSDDEFERIKLFHLRFSEILKREDEKSEKFSILVATLLTAGLISLSFIFESFIKQDHVSIIFIISSVLIGFIIFSFISLIFSVTTFFDIVFDQKGVEPPFRWLARLIGKTILNLSKEDAYKMIAIRDEGISTGDKLYFETISSKKRTYNIEEMKKILNDVSKKIDGYLGIKKNKSKEISYEELKMDIAWKAYLIHSRWIIRKWGLIFLGLAVIIQPILMMSLIFIQEIIKDRFILINFLKPPFSFLISSLVIQFVIGLAFVILYVKLKRKTRKFSFGRNFNF
jgi:hypothetical protein